LLHIFSFLFVEDLLSVGAGCREFRAISKDSNLSTNYRYCPLAWRPFVASAESVVVIVTCKYVAWCRRNVNVSFIGSCGAGKSTLVGHLHALVRLLFERACAEITLTWVGISIDCVTTAG
jgi:hypothetical protein